MLNELLKPITHCKCDLLHRNETVETVSVSARAVITWLKPGANEIGKYVQSGRSFAVLAQVPFLAWMETVETVSRFPLLWITWLKPGANTKERVLFLKRSNRAGCLGRA